MNKFIQFGEQVAGYDIPVLNEREIRAAAGILFLATYTSLMFILFDGSFILLKYVIPVFLLDLLIRVFINPRFSPTLILGRLIVRNQVPEYVGAPQKRFAWSIGIILSGAMFYLFLVVNAYGPITAAVCFICLIFLFFEAAFGICLGCLVYPLFFKNKVQHCPGEVCDTKNRPPIQKVSVGQLVMLAAFIALPFVGAHFFHGYISKAPHAMFKPAKS
ncbi:DUF4395 domain-containing protein [Chitinophaga qingshengii]|uniref:DUF4395 domain-containing protein n=1 Tax=Chitinophaga qingshengii TaxID=1569794 RepID=A0ABR7TWZ2_9BACT|nr:DUF4395 domain-containing protein [Chitinophaga qingshengii]MBC9934152.1 DUF4395 domain-containing protein [Chitinophaga qingshengii]